MFKLGSRLKVDDMDCQVIGYIVYRNRDDYDREWTEYRLKTDEGEHWLSWDDVYGEYSLSWPSRLESGNKIPDKWKKVDEGTQQVVSCGGDVDAEVGESAPFAEFEDETEEEILSLEMWEDGTEVSEGYYLDREDVEFIGEGILASRGMEKIRFLVLTLFIVLGLLSEFEEEFDLLSGLKSSPIGISSYITQNPDKYEYVTSITGNEGNKANVYQYKDAEHPSPTTDLAVQELLLGIGGETEVVTENEDSTDGSISILTKDEYALVYYPEGMGLRVFVQVSDRKYNYTSDQRPYRSRSSTYSWYRRHYYSAGYGVDSVRWSSTPSAYSTYDGPIVKDLGNGYFDVYSNSIRQSGVRRRSSDGGGLSGGK